MMHPRGGPSKKGVGCAGRNPLGHPSRTRCRVCWGTAPCRARGFGGGCRCATRPRARSLATIKGWLTSHKVYTRLAASDFPHQSRAQLAASGCLPPTWCAKRDASGAGVASAQSSPDIGSSFSSSSSVTGSSIFGGHAFFLGSTVGCVGLCLLPVASSSCEAKTPPPPNCHEERLIELVG